VQQLQYFATSKRETKLLAVAFFRNLFRTEYNFDAFVIAIGVVLKLCYFILCIFYITYIYSNNLKHYIVCLNYLMFSYIGRKKFITWIMFVKKMFQIKIIGFKKIYLLILSVFDRRWHRRGYIKMTSIFIKWKFPFFIAYSCTWSWEFFKTHRNKFFWLNTLWDMSWQSSHFDTKYLVNYSFFTISHNFYAQNNKTN